MAKKTPPVTPLALERRDTLPTGEAAVHLHLTPQTLRVWACRENGPIRPVRVGTRLAWPTAQIKKLVGVS